MAHMHLPRRLLLSATALFLVGGTACGQGRVILVTTSQAEQGDVEETEWAVGVIESRASAQVAAEVAGAIRKVFVEEGQTVEAGDPLAEIDASQYRLDQATEAAEVGRLTALLEKQERELERARTLIAERLIAQDQVDNIASELTALREQLAGARAQAGGAERRLARTRLLAPVKADVASRYVDVGDYVQVGTVAFDLIDTTNLRVNLPFPEYRAPQLSRGQLVRLRSASTGEETVTARVSEIRASVREDSRAVTVTVDFPNPGDWRPGGSVRAEVVMAVRAEALLIPQVSVVRRPVGDVVYVINDGVAVERQVRRGERQGRLVEIIDGLEAGEVVAVDGAGFLADGTLVKVAVQ